MPQPAFLAKLIEAMTSAEWESLCDGCGLCCQIRVIDVDTEEMALSNAACRHLCLNTHRCTVYPQRQELVPDCIKATPENIRELDWLPHSCGYRLAAAGQPLPKWHHLVCGDANRVHTHGPSQMGSIISEDDAEWDEEWEAGEEE